jgi:GTP-binding protein HflX
MDQEQVVMLKDEYPDAIFISAERGIGLSELEQKIEELIEDDYLSRSISIPISKYKAIAFIHENANVISEKYVGNNVELFYRIAKKDFKQLSHLLDTIGHESQVI